MSLKAGVLKAADSGGVAASGELGLQAEMSSIPVKKQVERVVKDSLFFIYFCGV
jgi:hypothetical protein